MVWQEGPFLKQGAIPPWAQACGRSPAVPSLSPPPPEETRPPNGRGRFDGRLHSATSGLFIALVIQIPAVTAMDPYGQPDRKKTFFATPLRRSLRF